MGKQTIAAILALSILAGPAYSQSGSEIELKKISTSERAKICQGIESALNTVIYSHPFNMAAGSYKCFD